MNKIKQDVNDRIARKTILLIVKPSCGYCAMAKETFRKLFENHKDELKLKNGGYEIWNISKESNCQAIQTCLLQLTGAKTVPRVFINGRSIGGCSELRDLKTKDLIAMINSKVNGDSNGDEHTVQPGLHVSGYQKK